MNKFWLRSILALELCVGANSSLFALSQLSNKTFGLLNLGAKPNTTYWLNLYALGVDANFKISPPDAVFYDRRIATELELGAVIPMSDSRYALRTNFIWASDYQRIQEKDPPISPSTTRGSKAILGVDFALPLNPGIELTIGAIGVVLLPEEQSKVSQVAGSSSRTETASMVAPRFSILKRSGSWNAGFYLVNGLKTAQSYTRKVANVGDSDGSKTVAIPPQYGIVANFPLGATATAFDFSVVKSGEVSPRTQAGVSTHDDYLNLLVTTKTPLGGATFFGLDLGYQTASYSSSAFTSLDTMPLGTINLYLDLGSATSFWRMGVLLRRGRVRASITEFNSTYDLAGIGIILGAETQI